MGMLEGKVALVTGGSSGIGLATALRFAVEGAKVFVTGRRKDVLDSAVEQIGHGAVGIPSDVMNLSDITAVVRTIADFGRGLDVIFANAGGGEFAALGSITPEHYQQTFDSNVRGTLFTVQESLAILNDGASIVLTGSSAASNGTPAFSVYAASKAAIRSFARTWAAELKVRRIRVNTLTPGPTLTPGLSGLAPDEERATQLLASLAESVPLGRLADPSEIASAAVFLASSQSSFVTGTELFVDGGTEQL